MIVSNILNRRNNYRLRMFQINFHTIIFDEIIVFYSRNETLLEKIE